MGIPKSRMLMRPLKTDMGEVLISQRKLDGLVNLTQMAEASSKKVNDWLRLQDTKEYLDELSFDTGIPVSTLVIVIKGGNRKEQGTWANLEVAIKFAGWCNKKFEIQVIRWFKEWAQGQGKTESELFRLCFYDDATPWEKRVPNEFWVQLKRLYGVVYNPERGAPEGGYPAKLVKHLIISRLPKFVQEGLDEFNPIRDNNKRKYKHHQWLKDGTARTHYEYIVHQCARVMTESKTRGGFEQLWDILFPIQEITQISLLPPNYLLEN